MDLHSASNLTLRSIDDVIPRRLVQDMPLQIKQARRGLAPASLTAVCQDNEANPLAVVEVLDQATDREWRDWEPAMLREFVNLAEDDVQQLDKVMACQVAVTNPDVFEDWALFHHVGVAFNHRRCHFEWLDKMSVLEAAWACVALRGLEGNHQFGPGVVRYLGALCIEEGCVYFPWVGGEGLHLCHGALGEWAKGLVDPELCAFGDKIKEAWQKGQLQDLEPSDIDESDGFQVQLSVIVRGQAYIRSQKPRNPEEY